MTRNFKIAQGQFKLFNKETEKNLEKIKELTIRASNKNCKLIMFPEYSYTGYIGSKIELEKIAETKNDFFVSEMRRLARENKIYIYAGYPELDEIIPGKIYNSAIFVNDEGNIISNMRKVYLWGKEKNIYCSGDKFPVVKTKFGNVGLQICYDIEFPEPSRIQMLKGAEIILNISYWSMKAKDRWYLDLQGNALYNLIFIAGVNAIDENLCGSSMIVGPDGSIVNKASETEEELLITEVDLDYVIEMRANLPYINDFKKETFNMDAVNKY